MTIRSLVASEFERVAVEHNRTMPPLSDDLELLDSGLDSLCFAVIVLRLEEALGVDPFAAKDGVKYPVTFRDFVDLYEKHPAR
jgi:acyl carrier protein